MSNKDYSKGQIYVIKNHVNDKEYIGSTINPLERRMYNHKGCAKKEKIKYRKLYTAFNEIGFDNFYIEKIEDYPCDSKEELRKREAHYIMLYDTIENGYNIVLPISTIVDEVAYKHDFPVLFYVCTPALLAVAVPAVLCAAVLIEKQSWFRFATLATCFELGGHPADYMPANL